MAQSPIKFYRGTSAYFETVKETAGMVYFNTDTKELLMGGKAFGLSVADKEVLEGSIKAVAVNEGVLTVTFNNGSTADIKLLETIPTATVNGPGLMSAAHVATLNTAAAKGFKIAEVTGDELTALGTNVKEAYRLVDQSNAVVSDSAIVKVYKDSSLVEVYLGASTDTVDSATGTITKNEADEAQSLNYVYQKADGSYEIVKIDVSKFLAESEFGDGLDVVEHVVSVNVGEDTAENKNFLDLEADGDGNKALAVRSIDTDSTVTTDRILVAGGPLDSTALRGILPKDESGNAYIEAGTDVQSLLMNLFTKVEWPTPTVTEGTINTTIAAPSFTFKNGDKNAHKTTVEVGTVISVGKATLSAVENTTTDRTCSEFTYGHATAVDGTITKTNTISIAASDITVNGDNYTMSRDFTGFTNTDDSATASTTASSVTLAAVDCVATEGTNKVKVSVAGPKGVCTFATMPSYYVASNVGTLSADHVSPTEAQNEVAEDTTPTNSAEYYVTGVYKYYIGCSTNTVAGAFNSTSIKALNLKTGNVTKDGTTSIIDNNSVLKSTGTSIVIACPAKYKLATITNGVGADILANFSSVDTVDYTNGSTTTSYKVYVYPITNGAVVDFKNVTLAKA
jgi:hypothetical protein